MQLAGTAAFYNSWPERMGKDVNLETDLFRMMLTTSEYIPDLARHSLVAHVTNEVQGGGYEQQILGEVSYESRSGIPKFSFGEVVFAAVNGMWRARRWVLFDSTAFGKPLVAAGLIDESDADIVVTSGNRLTLSLSAGFFFETLVNV